MTVAAVADACDADGNPRFNVVGLDLDTAEGLAKIAAINSARIPIATNRSRKPAGWRISNEQTADPRYANAAAGDLHLLTGSPAHPRLATRTRCSARRATSTESHALPAQRMQVHSRELGAES